VSELEFLSRYREIKRRLWSAPVAPRREASKPLPRDVLYISTTPLPDDRPVWEPVLTARDIARAVVAEVCAKHSVPIRAVMSQRRQKELVKARQEICWRLREETTWSLPQIGRFLGRDHTSILHSCRAYEATLRGETYVVPAKQARALERKRRLAAMREVA
jgi:hypothetical protein